MITVVYCTRQSNPNHKEHIIKTSGLHKHIEVIEIINNGESLTKAYNRGLKQAKYDKVVFCHDDLTIETKQWGHKLLKQLDKNPEFGIIGVAGTKFLPESGRWWEDRRKMYGRVEHTHEGKTWLSAYSDSLGDFIEETVIVDGLFFLVDKTKIKTEFNETVEGFHFYDVTFCFENYLKGVKVGVTTIVRVNHRSIGMTNDQWEQNRIKFSERFKDNLPVKIKRVLRQNEKLNVLIGCISFSQFTGSEMYVLELAKALKKQNCDVTICSNIGNPMVSLAKQYDINVCSIQEPPGFKLGDGQWTLKTVNGDVQSQPNVLYKISEAKFDVIHLNHKPITEHLLKLYPDIPVVCSIHSEVIALENPVISPQIKKYITIRPEIQDHIVNNFGIDKDLTTVIYNPIDGNKFKINRNVKIRDKKRILFVGTIDYLRKETIKDLINTTKIRNEELWIVGKRNPNDDYLMGLIENQSHVQYFEPTFSVEKLINECDETAGILLGRTTIEGWLCGKKGWIYDVDNTGSINSITLHDIPADVEKFKSENVAKEVIEVYKSILE
jgi:glycosyltransferase involved in cell wall biosynthesis